MISRIIKCNVFDELSEQWKKFSFNLCEVEAIGEHEEDSSLIFLASSNVYIIDIEYDEMFELFLNNGNLVKFYSNWVYLAMSKKIMCMNRNCKKKAECLRFATSFSKEHVAPRFFETDKNGNCKYFIKAEWNP